MEITTTGMEFEYYEAAMKGEIDAFEDMSGQQIESILTPNKNTILHVHFTNCIESVSESFVTMVLDMCPALLLMTNVKNETILHIAARYGHQEIVRQLIGRAENLTGDFNGVGAKERLIRALNDKKDTALHEAARYGHTEVVKALINGEPDHSFGENDGGETPLYIAIERRYWNVVDTILDKSNSPQYNGPNGRTALHAATIFGDKETVSMLLRRNSLLAKQADENGWVPLHLAAIVGSLEIVKTLVREDKSTAYMRDNKGRTALHFAAISGTKELDENISLMMTSLAGRIVGTPESEYISSTYMRNPFADTSGKKKLGGHLSVMKIILNYCPDCCELVDEKGCNALHYTATEQASFFIPQARFFDPFISEEEKEILKNLPQMRNLCNEKDDDGNTPLHYVARLATKWKTYYNHPLLEQQFQGVLDTMACNKYGQNPLDVAGADMNLDIAFENKLFRKLQDIGAMFGGRILDKHLREKKQGKRHDPAVDEKEKENKSNEEKENKTNYENDLRSGITSVSIVATLIATVTFAAGFTLPGGLSQEKGSPILKDNSAFIAFVIMDFLSFVHSSSAIVMVFCLSFVSKKGVKGKGLYYSLLSLCPILTALAMGYMIIAFGMGLYAVLGVSKGLGIFIICYSLSFVVNVLVLLIYMVPSTLLESHRERSCYIRNNYSLFRVRDVQLSDIV